MYKTEFTQDRLDQVLQIVSDAILTEIGIFEYRPQVGSILPIMHRKFGHPEAHVPEIVASITDALVGYVDANEILVRDTQEGLLIDILEGLLVVEV